MHVIRIYSTLGCHLCEHAKGILNKAKEACVFDYAEVEIADDEELFELYCTRIPVIKSDQTGRELDWPFDLQRFESWLKEV